MARAGPGQGQDPGAAFPVSHMGQGPKHLSCHSLNSHAQQQGTGLEVENPRLKPVSGTRFPTTPQCQSCSFEEWNYFSPHLKVVQLCMLTGSVWCHCQHILVVVFIFKFERQRDTDTASANLLPRCQKQLVLSHTEKRIQEEIICNIHSRPQFNILETEFLKF